MANVNHAPRQLSRRDFLKLGAGVFGALAFTPFTPLFEGQRQTAEVLDPHSLTPLFAGNTMTGLLVDGQNRLQRSVEPPSNIQDALDKTLKVFVPWTGKDPRKPDAPGGVCTFTLPDGTHKETKLVYKNDVKLKGSNEDPHQSDPIAIDKLVPVFDMVTGNVLVTDANGTVVRVVPPPQYQQGLADGKFTAVIPYHTHGGKKPDFPMPPGWCVIRTPDGQETSTGLQYARSIKLV